MLYNIIYQQGGMGVLTQGSSAWMGLFQHEFN